MIFDKTKKSVPESFGLTEERFNEINSKYESGNNPIQDVLEDLTQRTDLTEEERACFIFECGVKFGFHLMIDKMNEDMEAQLMRKVGEIH